MKLFEHLGELYVFVRVVKYDSISILAVERIIKCTVLETKFDYPEEFRPEEILDTAHPLPPGDPVTARILFTKELASQVRERQWAVRQKIEEQEDGSIILEVDTSGIFDVKKWVLSFGASARILEPDYMVREIDEEIGKMKNNYSS